MTKRILFICLIWAITAQAQKKLTVERIFSTPSLSGVSVSKISWSPDGRKVAYVRKSSAGEMNDLWVFDVATKKGHALVEADALLKDGQVFSVDERMLRERTGDTRLGITNYFWSPDSRVVYIPINGDVYTVDVNTKTMGHLIDTPEAEFDPKISPDGKCLAYVKENDIYVFEIRTKHERQLTTGASTKVKNGISEFIAQEEMGRHTGFWWSPDSKSIAYLQIDNSRVKEFSLPDFLTDYTNVERQEYPKAGEANTIVKVGVVSIAGGSTKWLDLGANDDVYVPRVNWFPDGKSLAVQIQSRNQDTLNLMLYDVEKGTSRLLVRETDLRWIKLHNDLRFLDKGKRFIWASERDGFKHLYLYETGTVQSSLRHQLTKGNWDVVEVEEIDEKRGLLYFVSFETSPLEKHLYSVKLDGTGMRRVSTSAGHHQVTMSPDGESYVDEFSSTLRPPLLALMTVGNTKATMIEENRVDELEEFNLPKPEYLTVKSADGKYDLNAYMIRPGDFDGTKKYPVIMYQYNGPTSQVVENRWSGVRMLWHRAMAEEGYLVFAVDGRGTPARGREFQNMLHKRLGETELQDQLAGVAYLRSLPYIDSTRMMIWGKSYGGFMTCMAMFTTDVFKLGIAVAPVTDWRNYDTHYTERYLEHPTENAAGYKLSSPVHYAAGLKGKFLLIHGVADDNVHFQDSMILSHALQQVNIQFNFMAYPRSTHGFSGAAVSTHWYNLMTRFIHDNL